MTTDRRPNAAAAAARQRRNGILAKWDGFLVRMLRHAHYIGRRRLRRGLRTVAGIGLMVGGVFGFLPVLGFWMFPLGLFLVILDIPGTQRALTRWLYRQRNRHR